MFYPTLNKSKPELIQFEFMQLEDTGTSTLPSQKRFANEDFNGKPVYQMNASKSPMSIDENLNLPSPTLSPSRIDSSSESNQLQISDVKSVFPNFDGTALDLQSLPNIIEKFDQLSQQLKSYLLFQLLKRCPVPTLQFISCLILPTLRRDFLSLLPSELSSHVLQYLDLRTLGRCCRVNKTWRNVIEGPNAQISLWKHRLSMEGWLNDDEIDAAVLKFKLVTAPISDAIDSDEEFSLSHKARVNGQGNSDEQLPPNLYKNLFRYHHKIRLNWFQGKHRIISFPGHAFNVVTCLQFDSDKIVSGSDDHTIHIYETTTGRLRRKLEGHEGGVWALQYWNDVLVSGSTDRSVRVWDIETGRCKQKFDGHTSTVRCLMIVAPIINPVTGKMEPEFPLIVTGSRDSTLRVWRLPDIKNDPPFNIDGPSDDSIRNPFFMHVLNGHTSSVRAIAGHGNVLVSGSYDHNVRVWNLTEGRATFCFEGHTEKVYSVGYSHELERAASGSMDATVRVWCCKTGQSLHVLKVGLLEFSSKYIVSAAADATLRVWSPTTFKCLATLTGHSAAITCFHHDPKLNRIVSGSDGGVKVWELASDGYGSLVTPPPTNGGPGFAYNQGPNGREAVNGRFIGDVVRGVQGVWRTRMDEKRLVCAVQKEGGRTWFEVLDFTVGVDEEGAAEDSGRNIHSYDEDVDASEVRMGGSDSEESD